MAADGQIVLGLNISETTSQISADLSTILNGLGTKQLILKAAIEKSQVEKGVASLVKEINQETAKIGIEVDPKSVSKVITQQQKMASMQKELVQQMEKYKQAASDVGLTLKGATQNSFKSAIDANDFKAAKESLRSVKKEIDEYNTAIKKMNEDTKLDFDIQNIQSKFNVLKNQTDSVKTLFKQLEQSQENFNNATSNPQKLQYYNELKRVVGQLEVEYQALKQSESALAIDSGIKKQMQDMDTYVKNLKATYSTIGDSAGAEKLKKAIQELDTVLQNVDRNAVGGKLATEWEAVTEKVNAAKRAVSEYRAEQSVISKKVDILDSISEKAGTMKLNIDTSGIAGSGITELSKMFDELSSRAKQLKSELQDLDPSNGEDVQRLTQEVRKLQDEFNNLSKSSNVFKDTASIQKFTGDIEKARSKVSDYAATYSAIKSRPDLVRELEQLQAAAANISTPVELKKFNSEFDTFNSKVVQAGVHFKQAFQNFSAFFSASRVIYQVIDSIKQMVTNVIALNTAMVELRKVTDGTENQFNTFLKNAKSNAVELGSTVTDLVNATSAFSRLGYSLDESEELGRVATIYANVGDDIDNIDQATTSLISTMKGFGIEAGDAINIVDKFNEVGNKFAISSGGIGDALQRSAASFDAANNTIDESIALVVAANNVIQDPDTVGTMWKTVTMRIRGAKTELEEAGLETEYMAESTASLRDAIKGLTNVDGLGGFDIMKDEKTFKSTYDIILGIGEVWEKMSDIDQAALLELVAGKRQGNALAATLTNLEDLKAALEASENSAGSAMKEQEIWLGSLEAKINQFKASFESLSSTIISDDLVGAIIDFGTTFVHTIDNVINSLGGMGNSLLILLDVIALFNFNKTVRLVQSIWNSLQTGFGIIPKITSMFGNLKAAWDSGKKSGGGFITTLKGATSALTANGSAATVATAAIMAVVSVIAIAVVAYKNWKQAQEEARQEIIDTGNEAAEHASNIIELANSYFALADAVDAGTAAKEDMLAAQDDVIKALGLEGQSVDELIDKYGDLQTAIKTVTLEQLDTDISQAIKGAKTAKKDVIGDLETWRGTGSITSNIDSEKAIIKWLYDQGLTTSDDIVSLPHSDMWDLFSDPSFEDLKENRDFLEKAMNAVRKEFGSDSDVFNRLSDAYDNYADALDPAVEAIDNANKLITQYYVAAARGIDDPKTQSEFEQFKKNIVEQLNSDFDFDENGSFTAEGLIDSILQNDRLYSQFYQGVEDALQNTETSVQEHGNKIKETLSTLWNAEGFEDTKKSILELANSLDGITADNVEELAQESAGLKTILDQDGMSAKFLANILQNVAEGKDGFALITDNALLLNQALEGMERSFDKVTEAKSRYDAAMSVPEKDEDFKSYAEAFKALNEQFEAGTVNSNAFWAAAEFLFGSDQLNEWGWSDGLDEIYQAMQKNVDIFEDADSAGAGFLERLNEIAENGQVLDDDGNIIAEIEKFADGSYEFNIDSTSVDILAEKLGISEDAALACLKALSMWGEVDFYNVDEVLDAIDQIGLSSDSLEGTAINISALTDQLISLGYTDKEIHDLLTTLQSVEGISFLSASADVDTLTNSLKNLGLASGDGLEVKVNTESLSVLMEQLGFTKDDAETLIGKLGEVDSITLTNAQGQAQSLDEALDFLDTLDFAPASTGLDDLKTGIEEVDGTGTDNAQASLDALGTSADTAKGKVSSLQTSINNLTGKTVTVNVDVKRKSGILSWLGFAKGTKNAPDGDALVGEEGEELVKSGDRAYLVGTNGPEIAHLNKGDTVYTAEETKKIKRGGGLITGLIPAYSGGYNGGAYGRVNPNKTYKPVIDTGKTTKTTTSQVKDATKAAENLEEQLKDTLDELKKTMDGVLNYFNHEMFLMEKKNKIVVRVVPELDDKNFNTGINKIMDFDAYSKQQMDYASQVVAIYKQMQETVHNQAEEYRKLGLDDTSSEIIELQQKWWEYSDSITDAVVNAYDTIVGELENAVTLTDNWLSNAIDTHDYRGIVQYTQDTVEYYQRMQDAIHEQAEFYRSKGYSDASDEVSKLSDLWWDYAEKIKETSANAWQQVVDNANEAVDQITGLYDTLHAAADEFAESGFITIDTLQEILSWGVQYLQYLKDENGMLVINEESIRKVIAARTEQMAIEQALAYVAQIRTAAEAGNIESLNNLAFATETVTGATWDLVYAQIQAMQMAGQISAAQANAYIENINRMRALADSAKSGIGQVSGAIKEANEAAKKTLEDQEDALNDLLKYVEEMIKQEVKNQVEALEDQVDAMKEIVSLQKKSLDLEKEKDGYTKAVTDKEEAIADLRKQIAALDLDDSREAAAKKAKLQEELSEKINDLADYQSDHAYDAASDMLDDMADAYEKEKQKEIDILENSISSEEKVYRLAIDRINNHWDTLYQDLINWNYEYGSVTNDEITKAWDGASAAVNQYGSYLNAILEIQKQIAAYEASMGSSSNGGANYIVGGSGEYDTSGGKYNPGTIISRMKENSSKWHGLKAANDQAGLDALERDQQNLAQQLRQALPGMKIERKPNGTWYINGEELYKSKYAVYHKGGVVGDDPTLKGNEVIAKLEKGETILTEDNTNRLYQVLNRDDTMLSKFGKLLVALGETDLMTPRMQEQIKHDSQQAQNIIQTGGDTIEVTAPIQVYTVQKLDEAEIRQLTRDISQHTITALNDSFIKRGKTRTSNPLKP